MAKLTRILQQTLFAPLCWGCATPLRRQADFCFSCRRHFLKILEAEGCLLRYQGPALGLLSCLRGQAPRMAAAWCFALLERQEKWEEWKDWEAIALAPQNPRSSESGLAILGQKIAARLKVPLWQPFTKINAHSQHGRSLQERMDTTCFVQLKRVEIPAKRVLLIDDVDTTGTTLDQCAYVLRKAGAAEVGVFSLARQMVPGFKGKEAKAGQEGEEVDPLLLHLFM